MQNEKKVDSPQILISDETNTPIQENKNVAPNKKWRNSISLLQNIPEIEKTKRIEFLLPYPERSITRILVYETRTRFYIVGSDREKKNYRLLKIDRTDPVDLSITEDPSWYSRNQIQDILTMIDQGNKSYGGLRKTSSAHGIIGFVRFLYGYYLLLITKKRKVGEIAGHSIYGIEDTSYIFISNPSGKPPVDISEETRYRALFFGMDMTKDFYFSYTYDLTNSLQYNMLHHHNLYEYNSMFVWNDYLMREFKEHTSYDSKWILPIIHGYYCQSKIRSIYGSPITFVLIARRSRLFAGTRFLKRGVNSEGYVANDVETEQIVMVDNAHPTMTNYASRFSSFVQNRGSIPLYWAQDISRMAPKPPIILQRMDPFYTSSILHVQDLFKRYGNNIIIFNLVKQEEKSARETILGKQFYSAVQFLNSTLPEEDKLTYIEYDFRLAHKSKQDMISELHSIAEKCLQKCGMFFSGKKLYCNVLREEKHALSYNIPWIQTGIIRTNCIDSLDRTNAAQFIIGKTVLGYQLYAMGLIATPNVDIDSELTKLLIKMYEGVGNQIALQYAGSELVNTMKTYRAGNFASQSRDLLTTMKRYYSNSFIDTEKQYSINLFLGNFVPYKEKQNLWELESDNHLHNPPSKYPDNYLLCNTQWWKTALDEFLNSISNQPIDKSFKRKLYETYFQEFYKPYKLSSFDKMFELRFNSTVFYEEASDKKENDENNPPTSYLHVIKKLMASYKRHPVEEQTSEKKKDLEIESSSEILSPLSHYEIDIFSNYVNVDRFTEFSKDETHNSNEEKYSNLLNSLPEIAAGTNHPDFETFSAHTKLVQPDLVHSSSSISISQRDYELYSRNVRLVF